MGLLIPCSCLARSSYTAHAHELKKWHFQVPADATDFCRETQTFDIYAWSRNSNYLVTMKTVTFQSGTTISSNEDRPNHGIHNVFHVCSAFVSSTRYEKVLRLLREPDPSLLPLELRGNESSSSGRRVVVSRPSRIMEIRLPPALLGKGDGFNDDVDDDTWDQPYQPRLNHEAHRERPQRLEDEEHEGTQDQLQEQTTRRVNASKSDSNPYHVKEDNDVGTNTTFSMTVRSEESHSSRRDASCSYVNCNTFGVGGTGNHRNEDDDSASVAWTAEGNNHNGSNDSNRGFPNERRKGGVPGDDLREIKRSAVVRPDQRGNAERK